MADGIANDIWKYRGEMREWVRGFCNKEWRGGGLAEVVKGEGGSIGGKKGRRKSGRTI